MEKERLIELKKDIYNDQGMEQTSFLVNTHNKQLYLPHTLTKKEQLKEEKKKNIKLTLEQFSSLLESNNPNINFDEILTFLYDLLNEEKEFNIYHCGLQTKRETLQLIIRLLITLKQKRQQKKYQDLSKTLFELDMGKAFTYYQTMKINEIDQATLGLLRSEYMISEAKDAIKKMI